MGSLKTTLQYSTLPGLWLQAQMTGQSACSVVLLDQSEASAALVARTGGASDRALISHGAADPSYQAGTREGGAGWRIMLATSYIGY